MKKIAIVLILILMLMLPNEVHAQGSVVKVTLPSFPVVINGVTIQNETREYPFIVYKGITYFPMTYYDARFLGLETTWSQGAGLHIMGTGISGGYRPYDHGSTNKKSDSAVIYSATPTINGKVINNALEEYPLLSYRSVTYFPMTWRWAVDAFHWKYTFDTKSGLTIQSEKPVKQVGFVKGAFKQIISTKDYYYYGDDKGGIYQTPINNTKASTKVFQLPLADSWSDTIYVFPNLYVEQDIAMLSYHLGGAVMGSDFYIQLKEDGSYQEITSGYVTRKSFDDVTIEVDQGVPPFSGNLRRILPDGSRKAIGNPEYLYGWSWSINGTSESGGASKDLYVYDDSLYLIAFNSIKDTDKSRIHKVNLVTNETSRVSDLMTDHFKMEGERLYCISNKQLYEISLASMTETLLETTDGIEDYQILDGKVYYVDRTHHLKRVGQDDYINPTGTVVEMKVEDNYFIASFKEESSNPYRMMILDEEGKVVFKTADVIKNMNCVTIENGTLTYLEGTQNVSYRAILE